MSVRFEDIKVGDKVKLSYLGLESIDWHEVTVANGTDFVRADNWGVFKHNGVEIIAHQPAPRKVEVTLGKPLDYGLNRHYKGRGRAERLLVALNEPPGANLYICSAPDPFLALPVAEARRLALDILATVGLDDE